VQNVCKEGGVVAKRKEPETYSSELFTEIKERAEAIREAHDQRDSNAKKYIKMYRLESDELAQLEGVADHVKTAVHPSPANKVNGLVDLMASTEAVVSVPKDLNDSMDESTRDQIEQLGQSIWYNSGMVAGKPLEETSIVSLAIFDEVHIVIRKVKDLLEMAQKDLDGEGVDTATMAQMKSEVARLKRILKRTPYLLEVINAQTGYPVWDGYGLQSYLSVQDQTNSDILARYGEAAREHISNKEGKVSLYKTSTVWEWWDLVYHAVWIGDREEPIMFGEHKLDFIPVACVLGRGTRLFSKPEDQRRGFFHTMEKSKLWLYQSVILSTWMTKMHGTMGVQFKIRPMSADSPPIEGDVRPIFHLTENPFFGWLEPPPGYDVEPVTERGVIDPASREIMGFLQQLTDESTLFDQALGRPIGGRTAFSTEALYHQAGQLPLETLKRQLETVIGDAITISLLWMKKDGGSYKGIGGNKKTIDMGNGYGRVELASDMIPEDLICTASLKVNMPQQKLQMLNAAKIATDSGFAPERWVIEELIGEDYKGWREEIATEQAAKAIYGQMVKNKVQEMDPAYQLQMQQMMMAAQQQQMVAMQQMQGGGGGRPVNQPGVSAPGGTPANPDQRMVQEMQGGLPPEMAAMGTLGPQEQRGNGSAPLGEGA